MDNRKERRVSYLFWCISISFMLFVFAPLEIYFTNKNEFWFGLKQLFPVVMVCFISGIFLLGGIYFVISKSKWFSTVYTIFLGILLGLYVQGNYIPRNYGVFDGTDIQWSDFKGYGIASILLWGAVLLLTVYTCIRCGNIVYRIGRYMCIFILLMQVLTAGVLWIQNAESSSAKNIMVTDKGQMELSRNKNIVIFLLDAFDSSTLMNMLDSSDAEEYEHILDNFTYYPDASGGYPTTKGSLPFILTGEWYENKVPYSEYVENAYKNCELYNVLREKDYSIGIYTDPPFVDSRTDLYENLIKGEYKISNYKRFIQELYGLVAFNYVPHQMKRCFFTYSGDFSDLKSAPGITSYAESTPFFYYVLMNNHIRLNEEKNAFRFYHLDGTHGPYTFGRDLNENADAGYNVYDEAQGCLNLLDEYFEQLKNLGVYDDTAIIIMADHGHASEDWSNSLNPNPLLLVKDFNERHSLEISDIAVSWEDVNMLFQTLASDESGNEFLVKSEKRERRFLQYSWDSSWNKDYLPDIAEYRVIGKVYDESSLIPTGKVFLSKKESQTDRFYFTKDTQIILDDHNKDYQKLVFSGFDVPEAPDGKPYVWTNQGYSYFRMKFGKNFDKDIKMTLDIETTVEGSKQTVIAYANGEQIDDVLVEKDKITIMIPNHCFSEKVLDLILYYPDAYVPAERGNEDTDSRKLAFCVTGITIEEY